MRAISMTTLAIVLALAASARADAKAGAAISADALEWQEMSAKAPGVLIATVAGNWKEGPYSAFIKFPPGSESGLHAHSSEMKVVVISGSFHYGPNAAAAKAYGPGSYVLIAADSPHTNSQPEGCLLFVEQPGKFDNTAAQ